MDKVRSRGWTITLNYYDEDDIEELMDFVSTQNLEYSIYGFEGVAEGTQVHPHIHFYCHYAHQRTFRSVMKHFSKKHHVEAVADPAAMIAYCKGYQNGILKEPVCGENLWFDKGIPIQTGVQTTQQRVLTSMKEGKTIEQIEEMYPAFFFMHKQKVQEWYWHHEIFDDVPVEIETFTKDASAEDILELHPDVEFAYSYKELAFVTSKTVCLVTDVWGKMNRHLFTNVQLGRPLRIPFGYMFINKKFDKFIFWDV